MRFSIETVRVNSKDKEAVEKERYLELSQYGIDDRTDYGTRSEVRSLWKYTTKEPELEIEINSKGLFDTGFMTCDPMMIKSIGAIGKRYPMTCYCGRKVILAKTSLLVRFEKGMGCLHPECKINDPSISVWANPVAAVNYQLCAMLNTADLVAYCWGGVVPSGDPITYIYQSLRDFILEKGGSFEEGNFWLKKKSRNVWLPKNCEVGYHSKFFPSELKVPGVYSEEFSLDRRRDIAVALCSEKLFRRANLGY